MRGLTTKILSSVRELFGAESQEKLSGAEILGLLEKQYQANRLITSTAVAGLVIFLTIAALFPFKDDLFSILYQKPSSEATTTINLVVNGNFEAGNLIPWQGGDQIALTKSPVHSGFFALQTSGAAASQKIAVTPGKTYSMTAYTTQGSSLYVLDSSSQIITTSKWQEESEQNNWTKVSFDFTAPSNNITLLIGSQETTIIFDDLQLFEKN